MADFIDVEPKISDPRGRERWNQSPQSQPVQETGPSQTEEMSELAFLQQISNNVIQIKFIGTILIALCVVILIILLVFFVYSYSKKPQVKDGKEKHSQIDNEQRQEMLDQNRRVAEERYRQEQLQKIKSRERLEKMRENDRKKEAEEEEESKIEEINEPEQASDEE